MRGLWGASPLFGWLWSCATCGPEQQINELRHDAEERDGVTKYGWLQHDGDGFGVQGIVDRKMNVNLTTSFIRPEGHSDRWAVRIHGLPIGSAKDQAISLYFYTSLADESHSLEVLGGEVADALGLKIDAGEEGGESILRAALATGTTARSPSLQTADGVKTLDQTYYYGVHIDTRPPSAALKRKQAANQAPPQQYTWAAKDIVKNALVEDYRKMYGKYQQEVEEQKRAHATQHRGNKNPPQFQAPQPPPFIATLPNTLESDANVLVIQRVLSLPFTMDFVLQPAEVDAATQASAKELGGTDGWFGEKTLAQALAARSTRFDEEFTAKFPSTAALASKTTEGSKRGDHEFSQALLSNLLGGIGYFHGPWLMEQSPAVPAKGRSPAIPAKIREMSPQTLFSAVPSRSFFPRGFMWDEGFHQLLVSTWNLDLSLAILGSWFGQIQSDSSPPGWLPREQILGEEARRRVPSEFQAQKPSVANPPVLILALEKILQRIKRREAKERKETSTVTAETQRQIELFNAFLLKWIPTIHMHVQWFFVTQASAVVTKPISTISLNQVTQVALLPKSFRWAGRTLHHCLASGLDDYPRARFIPDAKKDRVPNSAQQERDARLNIVHLASEIGEEGHVDLHAWMILLAKTMAGLTEYLEHHHQQVGEEVKYATMSETYSNYASELSRTLPELHWNSKSSSFADYVYKNGTRSFVTHIGYVSLLPMFLTVLDPTGPELLAILKNLRSDAWGLWTAAGLRSLSKNDKYFGSGEDYWKGHIWINMQYLAAQALTHYADHPRSPEEVRTLASELSGELRANVAGNVAREYHRTGYVWEQYHALTGKGRKSHPFTGWTALTLLIKSAEA